MDEGSEEENLSPEAAGNNEDKNVDAAFAAAAAADDADVDDNDDDDDAVLAAIAAEKAIMELVQQKPQLTSVKPTGSKMTRTSVVPGEGKQRVQRIQKSYVVRNVRSRFPTEIVAAVGNQPPLEDDIWGSTRPPSTLTPLRTES